jgi:hypothetical protein
MYLDSPQRDHNLLQAIARTNRPWDDPVTPKAADIDERLQQSRGQLLLANGLTSLLCRRASFSQLRVQ